jgi:hypothetical protein
MKPAPSWRPRWGKEGLPIRDEPVLHREGDTWFADAEPDLSRVRLEPNDAKTRARYIETRLRSNELTSLPPFDARVARIEWRKRPGDDDVLHPAIRAVEISFEEAAQQCNQAGRGPRCQPSPMPVAGGVQNELIRGCGLVPCSPVRG